LEQAEAKGGQLKGHVETLLDRLTVPEGPRWHDGRLWFSNLYADRLCAVDLSGSTPPCERKQ
jgi:hypothetical protein